MIENKEEFRLILHRAFEQNGLDVPDEAKTELLYRFTDRLLEVNAMFNLTAIRDVPGVIYKHLCDSAFAVKYIPQSAKMLDVGCGAGFPSFPCAILRDDITVCCLDSTAKKVNFINQTAEYLGLGNIKAFCGRAEEMGTEGESMRQSFDCVTARAVASLPVLTELCMPFVKVGGVFLAMRSGKEDIDQGKTAAEKVGGVLELVDEKPLSTPEEQMSRKLAVYRKTVCTPKIYPRRYGVISKNPL